MQLDQLPQEWKLFETVAGSHAYGTSTPESDTDIRGVFQMPTERLLSLNKPQDRVADKKSDIEFHELGKFFHELLKCGPNVIELLYMPEDCVRLVTPKMEKIIANRDHFISQKCYHSFSGYAVSQIKRAQGQNKWINNPQPEDPPDKLDFCWFINILDDVEWRNGTQTTILLESNVPLPWRPVKLSDTEILCDGEYGNLDLSKHHAAKLEHCENVYRLYRSPDAKGVFRNGNLVVESISKREEWDCFVGFLIYNKPAYEAAKRDWKNYWEWKKNRNEARYRTQEAGEIDYDAKNMLHCFRLLWSGINILEAGEPIVRFTGTKRDELMKIRNGAYTHAELMEWVEQEMAYLEQLKEKTTLKHEVDRRVINELYLLVREDPVL